MRTAAVIALFLAASLAGYAQEKEFDSKLTVDLGADLVSSYVWRGMYQSGVSLQPAVSLSAFGLSLGAWGSTDFSTSFKEIDFFLSYEYKGFRASISDYWWSGEGASFFKSARGAHHLEASLGFTFSEKFPLSLEVSTLFYGDDDKDEDDQPYYSSYISASFPFSVGNIDCEAGIGFTPRKGMYSDKAHVAAISLRAEKSLPLFNNYALPVFAELIFSPAQDNVYFVFGIRF